jgi:hypothetical protein
MKTIIKSFLFTVVLAMVMTGCQKDSDEINVSLKSAGILTIVDSWQSGNAAFECTEAGGACGYTYKIDEWDEEFGMDDEYIPTEGNKITILNSNGSTFDWKSDYPVCKVVVKAGRGAYVYSYPNGAYHDEGLIGYKSKGISHVTFCYGEPTLVIALKSYLTSNYATTSGGPGNIDFVGYYFFVPNYIGNKIYYIADTNYPLGDIIVSDIDADGDWEVTVNNNDLPQFLFTEVNLFVGTLADYFSTPYTAFPYQTGVIEPVSSLTIELN